MTKECPKNEARMGAAKRVRWSLLFIRHLGFVILSSLVLCDSTFTIEVQISLALECQRTLKSNALSQLSVRRRAEQAGFSPPPREKRAARLGWMFPSGNMRCRSTTRDRSIDDCRAMEGAAADAQPTKPQDVVSRPLLRDGCRPGLGIGFASIVSPACRRLAAGAKPA
jgi:hypothetical protein